MNYKELYDESVIIGPKQNSRLKCDRASALKSLASKVTNANQSQVLGGKLWVTRDNCLKNIRNHEFRRPGMPVNLSCSKIRGSRSSWAFSACGILSWGATGTVVTCSSQVTAMWLVTCLDFRDSHGNRSEKCMILSSKPGVIVRLCSHLGQKLGSSSKK